MMHKFRFRLEAGNGEAYESEASAQNGIASVQENAAHTPSPVCLNNQPPCASIAERNTIGESGPVTGCTCFCQCHADGVGWLALRLFMPSWLASLMRPVDVRGPADLA